MKYNLHTHTHYSDGKLNFEDHIESAIQKSFDIIGFSDHSPLPFSTYFSMKESDIEQYKKEIADAKEKYCDQIEILSSMEMDYIPGISKHFNDWDINFDYIIGSVHMVGKDVNSLWFIDGPKQEIYDEGLNNFYNGNIQTAVCAYFDQLQQMIQYEKFDILGHMDKIRMHNNERFFLTSDKWYCDQYMQLLEQVKRKDLVVEVNTRGLYKKRAKDCFPSLKILEEIAKMEIPVCISSDAHHPDELDLEFDFAQKELIKAGLGCHYAFRKGNFKEIPLY
ncbi:MAG: histidinol-phosphatase [Bacteroidales bacterium]